MVNVVRAGVLSNVDIPQAQHLVALNFDLCLAVAGCDRRTVLLRLLLWVDIGRH